MEFGLQKCAVAHMRNGRARRGGGVDLGGQAKIGELGRNDTYKYLGVAQMFGASQTVTKVRPGLCILPKSSLFSLHRGVYYYSYLIISMYNYTVEQ